MTLTRSNISGNRTTGTNADGGGLYSDTAVLRDSVVNGNSATGANSDGGGLANNGGLIIERSTLASNVAAGSGGGVWKISGGLSVTSSTIWGNSAGHSGGGIFADGLLVRRPPTGVTIENSTFSANTAVQSGGGLYLRLRGSTNLSLREASIAHSTITQNRALSDTLPGGIGGGVFIAEGKLNLHHTIIAANLAGGPGSQELGRDLSGLLGTVIEPHFSLIGTNSSTGLAPAPVGSPDAGGNLIGTNGQPIHPALAPLANNGGPTLTHRLLPDSPAINAGDPAAQAGVDGVPVHDQRGAPFTRVYGGRIDMGAVESQPIGVLAGDYNANGFVDAADYTMWRDTRGREVTSGGGADGNGDGVVDNWDYRLWTANFGQTLADLPPPAAMVAFSTGSDGSGPSPSPVPQPVRLRPITMLGTGHTTAIAGTDTAFDTVPNGARREIGGEVRIARRLPWDLATRHDRLFDAWLADHRDRRRSIGRPPTETAAGDDSSEVLDAAFAELGAGMGSLQRGFVI